MILTQADVHWIKLDSVDSTNDYLCLAYQQGRALGLTAVLAQNQTAGRGRAGRLWQATPGASLCLSLGLPMAGHTLPFLPLCVGVAVAQVLERFQVPVRLKWPNDLLLGQKKLGGVLCESFQSENGPVTVVGLGLNVLPVLGASTTGGLGFADLSMCLSIQALPSTADLAEHFVSSILNLIHAAQAQGIAAIFQEFTRLDAWLGLDVQALENGIEVVAGKAMGINEQGAYLVNTQQGVFVLNSGDLSLRALHG